MKNGKFGLTNSNYVCVCLWIIVDCFQGACCTTDRWPTKPSQSNTRGQKFVIQEILLYGGPPQTIVKLV